MTLANETALPPSQETKDGFDQLAASTAILAAVWIFQGWATRPASFASLSGYAFYAAVPLALLTALAKPWSALMVWRGPASALLLALVFASNARARRLPCRGRIPLVGWADRVHRRPRIPRRQRPREGAGFESRQSCAATKSNLRIAGLSLAGWNVVASAVLAVYAAIAARL